MNTQITLTVCEEVLIYQLSEYCLASCRHLQFENDLELTWEETFRADYLILLLPHSILCLVVISSSASNIPYYRPWCYKEAGNNGLNLQEWKILLENWNISREMIL